MKLNLSQAAEKAGVSRNTLYKHIKEGKVSAQREANGRQFIELSELLRAYGALNGQSAQDSEPKTRKMHTPNTAATPLEVQLAIAEERVRQLEARLQEKAEAASKLEQQYERIIQGLESQVRLLEHKQPSPVAGGASAVRVVPSSHELDHKEIIESLKKREKTEDGSAGKTQRKKKASK